MEEIVAQKGLVRLFLEVHYDLPFRFDRPMPLKAIIRAALDEHGGLKGLVEASGRGEFADEVKAVLTVINRDGETEVVLHEDPEDIGALIEDGE